MAMEDEPTTASGPKAADETPAFLAEFEALLHTLLRAYEGGVDEFTLIKRLQRERREGFAEAVFDNRLSLFRAHFLLFHALYRLRDRLHAQRAGSLQIHTTRIVIHAYQDIDTDAVVHDDPLRAYYLDLKNLVETTAEDVEEMLGAFWVRYYASERRGEALAWLGLKDPVDDAVVRRRYRELALEHHPDRGGDRARFQQISEAMSILKRSR